MSNQVSGIWKDRFALLDEIVEHYSVIEPPSQSSKTEFQEVVSDGRIDS